jgi:hypothetical protein
VRLVLAPKLRLDDPSNLAALFVVPPATTLLPPVAIQTNLTCLLLPQVASRIDSLFDRMVMTNGV